MKSKAKRNNNRPASFREKCRNAFAGAIKGLASFLSGGHRSIGMYSCHVSERTGERCIRRTSRQADSLSLQAEAFL